MTTRSEKGRALFYTRDSGGKHENTPGQYVSWAQQQASALGLTFDGTPTAIEDMIRTSNHRRGDLFLDYGISGNLLDRPALNDMFEEALTDLSVSHILIPRRDRFARPDDPTDAVRLEATLRKDGITLVFMDKICHPIQKGRRGDIGELIVSLIDYEKSGKDRRELAEKMIFAQIQLARRGFSVGGRPPYGFRRWLAREDGTAVRQLTDGERVRMAGHHVVWLPGPEEELAVIRRILMLLETTPASRVAAMLTADKVPTPDQNRMRTDNGIKHFTSGVWRQSVVLGIARNPLLSAVASYGRRSMGDQARFSPTGPRFLQADDYRTDGKPKVVRNQAEVQIQQPVPVKFAPILPPEQQTRLIALLNERAGTQRGKPRAQDPDRNPLGCRVFDLGCSWPMYRQPCKKSFRYTCGLYQQSHGHHCAHNHVDGPKAVLFLLSCLRQKLLAPRILAKLEQRLLELAQRGGSANSSNQAGEAMRARLTELAGRLSHANRNLGLAENEAQFKAISLVQMELQQQYDKMSLEVARLEPGPSPDGEIRTEVDRALLTLSRLLELAEDEGNYGALGELFQKINARLFLRFERVAVKNRTLNKLASGMVTFGSTPPPIQIYEGPTKHEGLKSPAAASAAGLDGLTIPSQPIGPGREGRPLGNVSRGDWIRTSDLLNPILRVKAASSRRISQMQAFWWFTNSTHHKVYADSSGESTSCPYFPGLSLPKPA
jgi:DNA invertase Pin-like site-specific DNA recombinase